MNNDPEQTDRKKLWKELAKVDRKADEEDRPLLRKQMAEWDEEDARAEKEAAERAEK